MAEVKISICIPSYKNLLFLERLLNSIAVQTFSDYEVVITDDSPNTSVADYINEYSKIPNIRYFKNVPALGTPENWNEGIRRANGTWIKLMHDDDWFTTPTALEMFYKASQQNPNCSFFFSAFQNVMQNTSEVKVVRCNVFDRFFLSLSPLHLFKRVYIGNPSCTFIKRDVGLFYDKDFKFVVDFEYYIRCMNKLKRTKYIDDVLLNIGFNNDQVTKYTFLVAEVQIPENIILLEKLGYSILRNIVVYDYYWRMFRNLQMRKMEDVRKFYTGELHPILVQVIKLQSRISADVLKKGFISKTLMGIGYVNSLFISVN